MSLMAKGIVDTFTLVELSETRLDSARARAEKMGLNGRLKFVPGDPFQLAIGEKFDLVYWNNALHHMNDADEAAKWSKSVLYPGGWFVMDDYVGPTRWQWPDQQIIIGERALSLLPERLLRDPMNPDKLFPRTITRPNLRKLYEADPSEAADSENIIPSIYKYFPNAEVKKTGGCIYHLALAKVLANFQGNDEPLLKSLLLLDEMLAESGCNHYALAIAQRI